MNYCPLKIIALWKNHRSMLMLTHGIYKWRFGSLQTALENKFSHCEKLSVFSGTRRRENWKLCSSQYKPREKLWEENRMFRSKVPLSYRERVLYCFATPKF